MIDYTDEEAMLLNEMYGLTSRVAVGWSVWRVPGGFLESVSEPKNAVGRIAAGLSLDEAISYAAEAQAEYDDLLDGGEI